jgi:hypothetical protein
MPIWSQHFLVITLVLACIAVVARQAVRALSGKKSNLNSCGMCKTCGPEKGKTIAEPKLQMITPDMLIRRRR